MSRFRPLFFWLLVAELGSVYPAHASVLDWLFRAGRTEVRVATQIVRFSEFELTLSKAYSQRLRAEGKLQLARKIEDLQASVDRAGGLTDVYRAFSGAKTQQEILDRYAYLKMARGLTDEDLSNIHLALYKSKLDVSKIATPQSPRLARSPGATPHAENRATDAIADGPFRSPTRGVRDHLGFSDNEISKGHAFVDLTATTRQGQQQAYRGAYHSEDAHRIYFMPSDGSIPVLDSGLCRNCPSIGKSELDFKSLHRTPTLASRRVNLAQYLGLKPGDRVQGLSLKHGERKPYVGTYEGENETHIILSDPDKGRFYLTKDRFAAEGGFRKLKNDDAFAGMPVQHSEGGLWRKQYKIQSDQGDFRAIVNNSSEMRGQFTPVREFTPGQRATLPPGRYTYVYLEDGTLVTGLVQNPLEMGVKHGQLALEARRAVSGGTEFRSRGVVAAGELHVDANGSFRYNIESGTFSRYIVQDLGPNGSDILRERAGRALRESFGRSGQATDEILLPQQKVTRSDLVRACENSSFFRANYELCTNLRNGNL